MSENLKAKTAKGVGWGFAENILGSGILAVANIVLARILSPSDFGIIGMTAIFLTLSTSLVDSGFTGALTRKKEVSNADLNTVFYFNLLVSVLLYAVLYLCAPAISRFFSQDILIPVIRILSLSLVINALGIVQKVLFVRRLDFRTQAWISLSASVTSGVLSIVAAVAGGWAGHETIPRGGGWLSMMAACSWPRAGPVWWEVTGGPAGAAPNEQVHIVVLTTGFAIIVLLPVSR